MRHLVKACFLLYLVADLSMRGSLREQEIICVLLIVAVNVFKERYVNSIWLVLATLALVGYGASLDERFGVLAAPVAFDFVYGKAYWGIPLVLLYSCLFLTKEEPFAHLMLLTALCSLGAHVMRTAKDKEQRDQHNLDEERRLRYELEQVKAKLLQSSREVAAIAEVRERNRIAREIHDSVGHAIAGVLFQLQAGVKLQARDPDKAMGLLQKSIVRLQESVVLLRDTVHNIKPQETLGIEYVKGIVENFSFCEIEFSYTGDFNRVPSHHLEILGTNLKEALTNAAKYSQATKIVVSVECNDKFTRLYMRDNGIGCKKITEGLGLSGMRERVANLGGNLSVSAADGFMIVCFLPREAEERREAK